jgi:hypothetical protein
MLLSPLQNLRKVPTLVFAILTKRYVVVSRIQRQISITHQCLTYPIYAVHRVPNHVGIAIRVSRVVFVAMAMLFVACQ